MSLGAALVLGIAGSAHCFTMCGPIAGAISCTGCPSGKASLGNAFRASIGRIMTYALLGAVAGGLGHVLVAILPGAGFRVAVRLMAALAIVVAGLSLLGFTWPSTQLERAGAAAFRLVGPRFREALRVGTSARPWSLGLMWGLVPCGLVYTALALAVDSGSALRGAATLLVFGLATLPAPLAVGLLLERSGGQKTRTALRRLGGIAAVVLGLVGVGRELGDIVPFDLVPHAPCCTPREAALTR